MKYDVGKTFVGFFLCDCLLQTDVKQRPRGCFCGVGSKGKEGGREKRGG